MKFKVYDEGYPTGPDFESLQKARKWVRVEYATLVDFVSPDWDGSPLLYGPTKEFKPHTIEIRWFGRLLEKEDSRQLNKLDRIISCAKNLRSAMLDFDDERAGHEEADLINALRQAGYDKYFKD